MNNMILHVLVCFGPMKPFPDFSCQQPRIDDVNDFIDTFRSEIRVARGADAIDNQFQWLYSRPE